jgi:thioredoxin reductase
VARALGCRLDSEDYIVTDARQATSVPFVFGAGDCDGGRKQVTQAMAEGETAGIELARRLREAGVRPQEPAVHRSAADEQSTIE